MHAVIVESLEEYLCGALDIVGRRAIEAHLDGCERCREELAEMRDLSRIFGSLQNEEVVTPSPAFYAGLMIQMEGLKPAPATGFGSWFGLDFAFGRKLVFASLLTMAVAGAYLATRETSFAVAVSPNFVMAQQDSPAFESAPAHDNMLVTLAAYGE
jgi:anti-sigma factor RsiW